MIKRRLLAPGAAAFAAATAVALLGLYASADAPGPRGVAKLRLLGVNDFHGHLEPPRPGLGGAAWLKAHLNRAAIPGRTIRVHAGDMVGTSPLVSSWFHDEPSIEVANRIGFDVGTVGNHEFDEGGDELLRLLNGGQRTGPEALKRDAGGQLVNTSSPDFQGAAFPYLAANTLDRDGRPLLPPYNIIERDGARVGFIGVTTSSTPKFLLPRHSSRFAFTDVSDAVNRWVPELRRRGVEAIVVLAHSGAPAQEGRADPTAGGEIVEEARQMSDAVDVVIAGHSHSRLDVRVPNASGRGDKLIVEALSYGIAYDRVDLSVDRRSGHVVAKSAEVPATPHQGIAADGELEELVAGYAGRVAPLGDRILGETSIPLTRHGGELAQLAADAQRELAGADLALVNGGSIRADIEPGPLSYSELFLAQPYDHRVMTLELSGRRILELLDRGGRLAVSGPVAALEPEKTYTVAVNELFASGSGLAVDAQGVGTEVEALAHYVGR